MIGICEKCIREIQAEPENHEDEDEEDDNDEKITTFKITGENEGETYRNGESDGETYQTGEKDEEIYLSNIHSAPHISKVNIHSTLHSL